MKVSVIIINYNTFQLTSQCMRSVVQCTRQTDFEIILVDNASTECDPAMFLQEFPNITLIRNPVNAGFAGGNNLGIEKSTGDFILLLNSDTILQEDSISKCVAHISTIPRVGVTGCRMIFPNGEIQHTARKFRSLRWELLDLFRFIPMLMSYNKRSQLMLGKYFNCDRDIECDWVNGAFFMFPKKILHEMPAGKLDDRFFMYGEDQLWCEQIRQLGYRILFYAGTTIIHINSGSSSARRQLALRKTMQKHELAIMRFRKGSGLYYYGFSIIYTLKEGLRNLVKLAAYKLTGKIIK